MVDPLKPTSSEPADGGATPPAAKPAFPKPAPSERVEEIGGPPGPEPTRYGDWQFNGKVTDF
ncbi:MAG: DUF1674 domain-containing protein [Enhydrobacter sp.]|nr:MAG: DUF1674 domain-containing protein [Enhydrobacter sp.]